MPDDLKRLLDRVPEVEADPRAVDALIMQLGAAMGPVAESHSEDVEWRLFLGLCGGVALAFSVGFLASALGLLDGIPTGVYLVVGVAVLLVLGRVVQRAREGEI